MLELPPAPAEVVEGMLVSIMRVLFEAAQAGELGMHAALFKCSTSADLPGITGMPDLPATRH